MGALSPPLFSKKERTKIGRSDVPTLFHSSGGCRVEQYKGEPIHHKVSWSSY